MKKIKDDFDKNDRYFKFHDLTLKDRKSIQKSLGAERLYLRKLSEIDFLHNTQIEVI